jgi:hypothetical protein
MIFHPIFLTKFLLREHKSRMSRVESKRHIKIAWGPISIRQFNENHTVRTENEFVLRKNGKSDCVNTWPFN